MRVRINRLGCTEVLVDMHDNCFYCEYKNLCPFINAAKEEMIVLRYEVVTVQNCKLFKMKEEKCQKSK